MTAFFHCSSFTPNRLTAIPLPRSIYFFPVSSINSAPCPPTISTGKRLSEVTKECVHESNKVAVWIGPGHVQEFYAGVPNCMVIDSADSATKKRLVSEFSSDLIRFYYGEDLIGNEIGAAAKNVIGIAAGMLDGAGMSTLKGPLMSRGTKEVARLIDALGGNGISAYGLCHLGDYEATVFSKFSHNREFGEKYVRGIGYTLLAEGYYTAEAIHKIAEKHGVEMTYDHLNIHVVEK